MTTETRPDAKPATFEAVAMPASVCLALFEAIEAGKMATSIVVHWRDRGATVVDRGSLARRLRRAGRTALAQKVLRADVPSGRVLVFVDLERGCNVTLAAMPKRPAPSPRVVACAMSDASSQADAAKRLEPDQVLVQPQPRAKARVRARASGQYLRDLEAVTRAPGAPRGRVTPHA